MMTIEIKINHGQPIALIEIRRLPETTVDTQHEDGRITSESRYQWDVWQAGDGIALHRTHGGNGVSHKEEDGAAALASKVMAAARMEPYTGESDGTKALRLLADLDRCEHGRHYSDQCYGCKGPSIGNLRGTGTLIGHSLSGRPYLMPEPGKTGDPDAWVSGD